MIEVDNRIDRRTFMFGALAAGVQAATADTSPKTFSQWLAASAKAREAGLASCLDRIHALDGDIPPPTCWRSGVRSDSRPVGPKPFRWPYRTPLPTSSLPWHTRIVTRWRDC
jgi:hypothetical protein